MEQRPYSQFVAPRYWPTWIGLTALRLIALMPLPLSSMLGMSIGYLFYLLGKKRRQIALTNIASCFPELDPKEQRRINRDHYLYAGHMLFASSTNWWCSRRRFERWLEVKNIEIVERAEARGENIILLAPHFLALEVGGFCLSLNRPITTMYQYSKNTLIDEVVRRGRLRYGGNLVERKEPLRKLLKLIRCGQPFYYLPDQDAGRKGVFVPFFHEQAATIPMLGKFVSMTNAVVIPCRTRIKPWGQGYEVVFSKPIENFPQGDEIVDTTKMNQVIEQMVRENPEQYFWAHKRFKTRPEGAAKFYK